MRRVACVTTQPVLATRALVKDYETGGGGTRRALDEVTIDVARGSFLSIMGPSGSGKSTLLHLLGGLDRPSSGDVLLDGEALSSLSDDALTLVRRQRIGFVFQSFNLVPVLTAAENVVLPAVIAGQREADYADRRDEVLGLVGLSEHRDHLPSKLSGGQQQRVAVARALFMEPSVLLADEPTGNLDSRTGGEVLALLRTAQDRLGQTVVLVTHDAAAAATGDDVLFLQDGKVAGELRLDGDHVVRTQDVLGWLQDLGAGLPGQPQRAPRPRRRTSANGTSGASGKAPRTRPLRAARGA
jgi:putative ABC transport system ATP-binding protein